MFDIKCNHLIFTISVFVVNQLTLNCGKCLPVENFDVLKSYSDEEVHCFSKEKFFYNGSCEFLNTRASCAEGETLVLNEDNAERIEPICKEEKCPGDDNLYLWWPAEKRCISRPEIRMKYCNSEFDQKLSIDNFGNGQCICHPWAGSLEGSGDCYKFYQRGPCRIDQVVTYNESTGYAVCSKDLCFDLNHPTNKNRSRRTNITKSNNESASEEKLYGPFRGTGPCYKFGHLEMCGSKYYRVVHEKQKVPDCEPELVVFSVIDGAPLCKVDKTTGKCREEFKLDTNDDRQNKPYAKAFLCRALRNKGTGKSMLKGC